MESGNSSSIQSSSGGDEEYDSRADSISSFLSPTSSLTFTSHPRPHPPPPSAASFDHLSTYLDAFSRPQPPAPNSNPVINCTGIVSLGGPAAAPYASFPTPISPSQGPYAGNSTVGPLLSPSSSSQQSSAALPEQPLSGGGGAAPPLRGSKKRSRASRRAPTTVLTTDTSNFRAMVQEFTGVPSPPFPSPALPRPRLDLLRAVASGTGRSTGMPDAMPGYLLRPFAQKVPLRFASGSSASSSLCTIAGVGGSTRTVSTTATSANTSMTGAAAAAATATASIIAVRTSTTTANNHDLLSDVGLGSQRHQNLVSMFNFQSLLPPSPAPEHGSPSAPNHGAAIAPQLSTAASYGTGDSGGRGHASALVGTLRPSFAASEGAASLKGGGDAGGDDVLRWFEGSGGTDGGDRGQLRPTGGSYGDRQQRGNNSCKLNCTGSASSDHHPEKGTSENNVATRGEGMVDSWICSSD